MNTKYILVAVLFLLIINPYFTKAQDNVILVSNKSSGCTNEALQELIKAVNEYRADKTNWSSTVIQKEFTLAGVSDEQRGLIELPINTELMNSANETARKFADGTYPEWDHVIHGEGPTMRAIKNGWKPSMNKLFYANEEPVFTMVTENLFNGSSGYKWQDVLNSWEKSPGHNTTLLSRGAVSIGCGCADNNTESYWVLLVEIENSFTESDDIMDKYFKEGVFYKIKSGIKNSDLSRYKANEVYEFIDGGLQIIKDEK